MARRDSPLGQLEGLAILSLSCLSEGTPLKIDMAISPFRGPRLWKEIGSKH